MAETAVLIIVALALAISIKGALGGMMGFGRGIPIRCEDLDKDSCAFSVSASGRRCVLENRLLRSGAEGYTCATSEIVADKLTNHVESDDCVRRCGLDRHALGISSDSLLDRRFAASLCSDDCFQNCPNIVDLYFNLAAGEGVYLMKFCEVRQLGVRRGMMETLHGSEIVKEAAPAPAAAEDLDKQATIDESATVADAPATDFF